MERQARRGRGPVVGAAGLALAAAALTIALVPGATGQTGPSPVPEGCQLKAPQPEAPLKLNVVAVGRQVKAVAMQKEVFNCFDGQTTVAQIKDVETFIELIGRRTSRKNLIAATARRVEAITCTKNLRSGRVGCGVEPVQVGVATAPVAGCSPVHGSYPFDPVEQPSHPVEMASVVLGRNLVHTVKVEKEVFDCGGRIGDVYLFTEITEASKGSRPLRTVARRFSGVVCLKDAVRAKVVGCRAFRAGRAS